ncbi:aldehyde dehydrogenase family protein [Photorhabdus antumapuensis]|uniref:aldehyde dehydrogenase family protein n=1 Tax=Photorhabdus antumapuensis TaxID=2862867 RepID=UPI001CEDB789|nr:aldehyde dehydrogenase family protein [Photorhabdus antumapuensis]MCA6219146.1 aldehyde dehydrogenase family protein [Photorhabdus antumapuensis]
MLIDSVKPDVKTAMENKLQQVEALALGESYVTRRRAAVTNVLDKVVGETAIAPPVYICEIVRKMRIAPQLRLDEIHAAMKKAAKIYSSENVAGLSPAEYVQLTHRVIGLPAGIIERSLMETSEVLMMMPEIIKASMPHGAVWDVDDNRVAEGCALFSRRADVLAVLTGGNGPGAHALWPQALAFGYRILVKPSVREPFTAQRLVSSLTQAGLGNYVALIPTDHQGADEIVFAADLSIIYGGQDVVNKYHSNPKVLIQGPGHSKIVVGSDVNIDEAVSLVAQSVTSLGGAACVSASAVLVEGDPVDFGKRLLEAFNQMNAEEVFPLGSSNTTALLQKSLYPEKNEDLRLFGEQTSSGYTLRPYITVVDNPIDPLIQRELPFPCVTVAPYDRLKSSQMLSDSLVVTVFSKKPEILDAILSDTTISNVYVGDIPTTWMAPLVPHDGYLSEFLMHSRGVRIQKNWLI